MRGRGGLSHVCAPHDPLPDGGLVLLLEAVWGSRPLETPGPDKILFRAVPGHRAGEASRPPVVWGGAWLEPHLPIPPCRPAPLRVALHPPVSRVWGDTDPVRVEGQAADGPDALAHKAVVVLDVVDELPAPAVDGRELVHGAAAHERVWREPSCPAQGRSMGGAAGASTGRGGPLCSHTGTVPDTGLTCPPISQA